VSQSVLHDVPLVAASVGESATFADASAALAAGRVPAIAVLDAQERVVGLFASENLLRGLFPPYLEDLRHTAFAPDDVEALAQRNADVAGELVTKHMRKPISVELGSSALHVAERFLHCDLAAIAVVEEEKFVGMLDRAAFCRAMLGRF